MLHVAVLEPDRQLADAIMSWLSRAGHNFTCCSDPDELSACLASKPFDLLLLDCSGHQQDCFELIEQSIAGATARIPLLYISQPDAEVDIIRALEHGADDYVVKPFGSEELLNRIHVLVRRLGHQACELLPELQQFGCFTVDRTQRQVCRDNNPLNLTDKDFCLADFLFTHPNQLLSRQRLLSEVWGVSQQVNTRTVDMHISRLRKALLLDGTGYQIQTVHQHGYRLQQLNTDLSANH